MKIGIYKIENEINGKVYIGSGQIRQRYYSHMSKLRRGIHENKHLQNSWDKYGSENFNFKILIYCSEENLDFYENKFIVNGYESHKRENGYNFKKGRNNADMVEEVCNKISKSLQEYYEENEHHMKGKTRSQEVRDKISKYHKGKKLSEENRQKLSKAKEEYYKNNENPMKGREHSEETKNLMSDNRTGEKNNQAELNEGEVKKIKKLLKETKLTYKEIGNKFNVSSDCIANIGCGSTWSHIKVDGFFENNNRSDNSGKNNPMYGENHDKETRDKMSRNHADFTGSKHPQSELNADEVKEIKNIFNRDEDKTLKEIADIYGVSISCISSIKQGRTWEHIEVD